MIDRRLLLACAAAIIAVPAVAQAPSELKIIAPAGPGGGWDTAARSIQQVLTGTGLAKSVQVQNVTGAGGTVGAGSTVGRDTPPGALTVVRGPLHQKMGYQRPAKKKPA